MRLLEADPIHGGDVLSLLAKVNSRHATASGFGWMSRRA
jgi:hypothetical protein